ncbi:glycine cleavage system aminomethyltransferase GcvT [Facklamia miroungae]|uniref:Aminomethyltransferase n=1 Tax=Facklamia miroungae TaxID=120956 RepID=A0A1G7TJU0_9LACT|nr:glycine cleavage system aminomethyltransferase GcvT [Facklamia miroungae]NKZ29809.1 glycine cleavage system aminomethyltransferase GcvT [Facklamia miroungae]SDG35545.1 aminomethyltransferase [Facklamia miroungae]
MTNVQVDENGLKKTPMYDYYVEKGCKITDFGGWGLPIQITKIAEEHEAVRNAVGLFDASHMGEVRVKSGKMNAYDWWNGLITNDVHKATYNGKAQYTAVCKEDGGMLDDLIYYRRNDDEFVATPNGSNREKIVQWMHDHNQDGQVEITDETYDWGLIAVQGPNAEALLARITDTDLKEIEYYSYKQDQVVAGIERVQISRTGYTGEEGFELYIPSEHMVDIWKKLVEEGQDLGVKECALGARDTLRLEAGLPLYGNDFDESVNPIAGGIAFAVPKAKEADYIGKEAIAAYRAGDKKEASRGFKIDGKQIARHGMEVKSQDGEVIGVVTSGTKSPSLGYPLGFVRVNSNFKVGDKVIIDIRGKEIEAELTKKDWLSASK